MLGVRSEWGEPVSILVICRRCGAAFTATRADILAGPAVWRLCPACRGPEPPPAVSCPPPGDASPVAAAWRAPRPAMDCFPE
jgi:hypothetical protein